MNILFTIMALVGVLALLATCVWLVGRNPVTFLANVAEGTHKHAVNDGDTVEFVPSFPVVRVVSGT